MSLTQVSEDILFRGEIRYKGSLEVNGVVQGKIVSDELLTIGPTGKVKADIAVRQLHIKGELTGNIAGDLVTISGSGKLYGDIACKQLQIERGGIHNGTTVME